MEACILIMVDNLRTTGRRRYSIAVEKTFVYCETPILKANNLKVTIGAAELVSCNETL